MSLLFCLQIGVWHKQYHADLTLFLSYFLPIIVAQSTVPTACFQCSIATVLLVGSSSGWSLTVSAPMEPGLRFHPS